jgi:hypothetical protein
MLKLATGQSILSLQPLHYLAIEEPNAGKEPVGCNWNNNNELILFLCNRQAGSVAFFLRAWPRKRRVLHAVSVKSCPLSLHRSQICQDLVGSTCGATAVSPLRSQMPLVKAGVRIS